MKVYRGTEEQKSWAIKLEQDHEDSVKIVAVDCNTGEEIATLVRFYTDGQICSTAFADKALKRQGYDPHEHGNQFTGSGRIIIKTDD